MSENRDWDQTAKARFEYELLTNELFHLCEFTSLVDFDPLFRNSSDSFRNFLVERNLDIESAIQGDDAADTSASRRLKRRHAAVIDQLRSLVDSQYDEARMRMDIQAGARGKKREQKEIATEEPESNAEVPRPSKKRHTNGTASTKKKSHIKKEESSDSTAVPAKRQKTKAKTSSRKGSNTSSNTSSNTNSKATPSSRSNKTKQKVSKSQAELVEPKEDPEKDAIKDNDNDNGTNKNDDSKTPDIQGTVQTDYQPKALIKSDDQEFYFTSSSEDEDDQEVLGQKKRNNRLLKKLKVKIHVHPPKQTITNPAHVIKPEFDNVHSFLESFKILDEDMTLDEYDDYIKEQRKVAAQIRTGFERGALRYDPQTDSLQSIALKDVMPPANSIEPISLYYKEQTKHTHQEHLINQGIVMSKAFQENRRARIAKARRVAQIVESHFKHIAGAEERKLKEEERRKKNLARSAMQAVKKRWTMAEKAYKVLKKDEMERLERIQGKQHLSEMLEQSTQLLGAQLNQIESSAHPSDDSATNSDISEDESDSDDADEDEDGDDSDEMMSTSSSESEKEIDEEKNENDMQLSVEELRMKYAALDEASENVAEKELPQNGDSKSVFSEESDSASDSMEDSLSSSDSEDDVEDDGVHDETPGLSALLGNIDDREEDDDDDDVHFNSDDELESVTPDATTDMKTEELPSPPKSDIDNVDEKSGQNTETVDPLAVADVPVPSLLRGTLRIYQKQGLNWLASLYNNKTNGILADEMGLGKTIQTISLLAYLACEKENWGPHLIVVPTSVLLNWEMEFKRFAPGFKVLTYYGSPQQRREKRKGWNKPDAFHICITSYQLVVHDQHSFKRKKWQYMILDEAHNIKNFRSTRWQALLNFNTERRLLLTGTPLQNNLAELWSLLYFLMPQTALENGKVSGFADLDAFQQWFGRPVDKIVETGENYEQDEETKKTVSKLHQVLRPYLLRRLKADVEKQMPGKYEHIIYCRLSKRQRFLYDDFMSRAQTKETLASGNFMSIINCLMQLRKVCNHPDLFEVRPVLTSFCIENSVTKAYCDLNNYINHILHENEFGKVVDLSTLNFLFTPNDFYLSTNHSEKINQLKCVDSITKEIMNLKKLNESGMTISDLDFQDLNKYYSYAKHNRINEMIDQLEQLRYLNELRCAKKPMYGSNVVNLLTMGPKKFMDCNFTQDCIKPLETRLINGKDTIEKFAVITPAVVTLDIRERTVGVDDENHCFKKHLKNQLVSTMRSLDNPFHQLQTKLSVAFPDKSLLQYDCGKLQKLAQLLQNLKDNGHRALIFTQMTKVLDILEQFLNFHGYLYMRLDGATKIEDRQILTERFNSDPRITVFILSSRSGGLGINLTGADTVIFYDSDWNPAMDKQCQDRCHRIGQTRDVHIYRFVSEHTIESNILKKANQKRHLDNVVIQTGDFTTDYFTKLSVKDLLGAEAPVELNDDKPLIQDEQNLSKLLLQAEDEDDAKAAKSALREVNVDNEDFQEGSVDPQGEHTDGEDVQSDNEYGGTNHVEEYMVRFIANGHYY
ncbi:helicase SWR1 [Kluyveromyces marxianus]|nr:helicase SWR1 [Kluyveromyces marxianus]